MVLLFTDVDRDAHRRGTGVGLTEQVSGHSEFLHDGRARSLIEAILWHGGEAQSQRDTVAAMQTEDRDALLAFLGSL